MVQNNSLMLVVYVIFNHCSLLSIRYKKSATSVYGVNIAIGGKKYQRKITGMTMNGCCFMDHHSSMLLCIRGLTSDTLTLGECLVLVNIK